MRRSVVFMLTMGLLVLLSAPVLAGGWAVVHLDEPPGDVLAGEPMKIGFMVLQHDVSPISEVTPVVTARHQETGEEITFTAEQEGPVGHFVAEVVFPEAGDWKWEIVPAPFAGTTFETLAVVDRLESTMLGWPAGIYSGGCTALGDELFSIGDVAWQPPIVKATQLPVAVGSATLDASLPDLLDAGLAIAVQASADDPALLACGAIEDVSDVTSSGQNDLVLGLQHGQTAVDVGVAVLHPAGEQTEVTLYVPTRDWDGTSLASVESATVEIMGGAAQDSFFSPPTLRITPGTRVTWINNAKSAHMVSGDDLAFDDSGWLEPGESFSQIFDGPGEFHYRCGPHPWMEATIVVA
jgi:plastocyanin